MEINRSEEEQGDIAVVQDVEDRVVCRVRDAKQYQVYLSRSESPKKRGPLKNKGKAKVQVSSVIKATRSETQRN